MEQIGLRKGELLLPVLEKPHWKFSTFGSTSISGAIAKPIIDIAVGAEDLNDTGKYIKPLKDSGYKLQPPQKTTDAFYKRRQRKKYASFAYRKLSSDVWTQGGLPHS